MNRGELQTSCALVALLLIAIGIVMGGVANFGKRPLPRGLHLPVLAMELLRSDQDDPSAIVGPAGHDPGNDRCQMAAQMYLDFSFIPTYTLLFVLVGAVLYSQGYRRHGVLVCLLIIAAAGFDVLENCAILSVLGVPTNSKLLRLLQCVAARGSAPRLWSLIKWALIFVVLAVAARVYFDPQLPTLRRWMGFLAGGLWLAASALGLGGVVFKTDRLIEAATKPMVLGSLVGLAFFATHSWLAQGLLAALNRLAGWRWFR